MVGVLEAKAVVAAMGLLIALTDGGNLLAMVMGPLGAPTDGSL